MTIQEAKKHHENSIVVYYNDEPFKIQEMRRNNRVLLVSTSDSTKKKQVAIKNLVSSVDLNASGFEKKPDQEQPMTAQERLKIARRKLAENPSDTIPLREELLQWDFVRESVFIGLYLDVFKDIPSNKPDTPDFRVYGFRSVSDANAYGLGGYAINQMEQEGKFIKGKFYQVEFLGKQEGKSGRTFNRYNIYQIPDDLESDFLEMLKSVPGSVDSPDEVPF